MLVPGIQGTGVTANGPTTQSVLSGKVHTALAVMKHPLSVCEGMDVEQQYPTLGWKSLD